MNMFLPFSLLFTFHICFLTCFAGDIVMPNSVICTQTALDFTINGSSSLFHGSLYDVEVEDLDVNHTLASCPKWGVSNTTFGSSLTQTLPYVGCNVTLQKIYDGSNDVSTLFINHHFVARSVNKTTYTQIQGTVDVPFMLECIYQVKGDVSTLQNVSGSGTDHGSGSVNATDKIDMWISDAKTGLNISGAVPYGTQLTLNMKLNDLGQATYANIAPQMCEVGPALGTQTIHFIDDYEWDKSVFDTIGQFESIERDEDIDGKKDFFHYKMNFSAFTFESQGTYGTLKFHCIFRLCVGDSDSCNMTDEAAPYSAPDYHRSKRSVDEYLNDYKPLQLTRVKRGTPPGGSLFETDVYAEVYSPTAPPNPDMGPYFWYIVYILVALFLIGLLFCCCCCFWRYFLAPAGDRGHRDCEHHCSHQPQPMMIPYPVSMGSVPSSVAYTLPSIYNEQNSKVERYLETLEASEASFANSRRSLVSTRAPSSNGSGLRRSYN